MPFRSGVVRKLCNRFVAGDVLEHFHFRMWLLRQIAVSRDRLVFFKELGESGNDGRACVLKTAARDRASL